MQFLLAIFTVISLLIGPRQAERSYVWQQIDADIKARADGTLAVTETMTLRYTGGPYTFAFRDLPDRRLDSLSNVRLADAEGAFQQVNDSESTQPRTFSIEREDGVQRVRWVYPPTSDATRTFTLSYDVAGAVRRYADHDEIWWSVVFPNRDVVVEQATGTIRLPQTVEPASMSADAPDAQPVGTIALAPGTAKIQGADIAPGQELSLRLEFPTGIIGGATPAWQTSQEAQDQYDATLRPLVNVVLSLLAALVLAALGFWAWLWARKNHDPRPTAPVTAYEPGNLNPAEAARLTGKDANVLLLAILFDLANRGYLTLNERMGGWNGRQTKLFATRTNKNSAELSLFEQEALAALFATSNELELKSGNRSVTKALPKIRQSVDASLQERDFYDSALQARRTRMYIGATVLMLLGGAVLAGGILLAQRFSYWLPALGIAMMLGSMAWFIAAAMVKGFTRRGAQARAQVQAYATYLRQLDTPDMQPGQFGPLLPYAAALGDAKRFTRRYALTNERLPYWYYPTMLHASHNPSGPAIGDMGTGGTNLLLRDFSQNFVTAITSSSAATSSPGSGGAGGGGGASGGGGGGAG